MQQRFLFVLFLLIIIVLGAYWLKCRMSIDFSEKYSVSKYIPFKYLTGNDVIAYPEPGVLLSDSFNSRRLFRNWSNLWMREKGSVTRHYEPGGSNNTRCLVVTSTSEKSWSIPHNKFVEVKKGDTFSYEVSVRLQGGNIAAYAGVAAFDENKHAVSWDYNLQKADATGRWVRIEQQFRIADVVPYIQFRIVGTGAGEYRFDDVRFEKLSGMQ